VLHKIRISYIEIRPYSSETISREVQDALICVEMFFISVVHWWTFPVTPFRSDDRSYVTPQLGDVVGYRDTYHDLHLLWNLNAGLKTSLGKNMGDKNLGVELELPASLNEIPHEAVDSYYHALQPAPEKVREVESPRGRPRKEGDKLVRFTQHNVPAAPFPSMDDTIRLDDPKEQYAGFTDRTPDATSRTVPLSAPPGGSSPEPAGSVSAPSAYAALPPTYKHMGGDELPPTVAALPKPP
jgi:hypothetical protein